MTNKTEIWAKVDEGGFYAGLYEVSSWGRWKVIPRIVNSGWGERRHIAEVRITEGSNTNGYRRVMLKHKGIRRQIDIHVLVARAFIPNPLNLPCVNHIDADKSNNRVENLEWCTHKENSQHAKRLGLYRATKGVKRSNSKLTEDDVREIRRLYRTGAHTYRSLAKLFPVCYSNIDDIINFKRWKHVQ